MIFFTLKIVLAAIIIAFASWLSGQNPKLAGFIIALPPVSYTHLTLPTTPYV